MLRSRGRRMAPCVRLVERVDSRCGDEGKAMSMIMFSRRLAAVVSASLLLLAVAGPTATDAKPSTVSHKDARVCGPAAKGHATCLSIVRTLYRDGQKVTAPTTALVAPHAGA